MRTAKQVKCAPEGGRRLPLTGKRRWMAAAGHLRPQKQSVIILCYHGVSKSDEHLWNPQLYIQPEVFQRRLGAIRDFGYDVLPLSTALEQMRGKGLAAPTVVITFDDGWHDFHEVAWPILRQFNYPATVYQTTFYSRYNRPIFDTACSYLLWKGVGRTIKDRQIIGNAAPLELTTPHHVEKAREFLLRRAKECNLSAERKDWLLQRLAEAVRVNYETMLASRTLHLMDAAEIREVAQAGIDIQLHTHRHRLPFDKQLFLRELDDNRQFIESATGKSAREFCYPNGAHRSELVSWLREAGIASATTCDPGTASWKSEPLLLPRLADGNSVSQSKFESWLAGTGLIAPTCRHALRSFFSARTRCEVSEPITPTRATETSVSTKAAKTWA